MMAVVVVFFFRRSDSAGCFGVADGSTHGRGFRIGLVEIGKTTLGFAQVAVVEGVGMHFHEKREGVEHEEDLSGPGPLEHEGPAVSSQYVFLEDLKERERGRERKNQNHAVNSLHP